MAATIKDIARMVGVSPSTVSRVLNGNAVISEETKTKIRQAMKELDYHPNSRARNFANGSTDTIALVVDAADENTFSNSFFNRSVYAIEKVAQAHSYNLLITNDNGEHSSSISTLVYEKKVDGLILPPSSVNKGLLSFLDREEFPYVVLGEPAISSQQMTYVDIDNRQGSIEAVTYLKKSGYGKIVMVAENEATVFSRKRIAGYRDSIEQSEPLILLAENDYGKLETEIMVCVKKKEADAFLCASNEIAFHVLRALRREQIRVPEAVGIVTFDNYPLAEYMEPPLTVVDVDTYELGKKAAEKLIEKIQKKSVDQKTLIETALIVRGSSGRKE